MNKYIEFYLWMTQKKWYITSNGQWCQITNEYVNPIEYVLATEEELMIKFQAYLNGKT